MEISPGTEVKKTERISDTEMGRLLSAIGNHEAKAIALIGMELGVIYAKKDLHDRIMELQGKRKVWSIGFSVLFDYCEDSLSPIGLVTQEALDSNLNTLGYIKSGYGQETGVPFAGRLLRYSFVDPEHSLQDYFAKTGSSSKRLITEDGLEAKKRAPAVRIKIFRALTTLKMPITDLDLVKQTGESSDVVRLHINILAGKGLISYDVPEYAKPVSFYTLSPNHPPGLPAKYRYPTLETFVYQTLIDNSGKKWTRESMADLYIEKTAKQFKKEALMSSISKIFSYFLKTGHVERGKFSNKNQSEINLIPEQRKAIADLVAIIDGFQDKDPKIIKEGRGFANYLLTHPEAVCRLLLKAKEHSTSANATPATKTEQMIIGIVSSSSAPLINKQVQELLKKNYGKILSIRRVRSITYSLLQRGDIVAFSQNGVVKSYGPLRSNPDPEQEGTL